MRPGVVAHDGGERGALGVVSIGEEAAGGGLKSEGAEVVTGDEFAHHRFCDSLRVFATRRKRPVLKAGFHRCQLIEFRQVLFEHQIRVRRKKRIVSLLMDSGVHAAIIGVADADEGFRIGNGQIPQQTALTSVKMAALAPMPSASVRMTVMVKPGVFRNWRNA